MAQLSLHGVKKAFGNKQVVHGVDCDLKDGEFLVIVGPSGCGKSTLLRMIAGLEVITEGEIAIDGRVINDLEPAERDIAMVFQTYALYPHMSVYDNMAYGLKIRRLSKAEIDQRVRRAAEILELGELLKRKPRQLSGGQRQRVAMGRAIVREPAVFLFDEPLSNLDAKLRAQMRLEIKKLQAELGVTSVYVTHDQVEAMTLGHRLLVMNLGNVEQLGTPLELYDHPATVFVAGFLGAPAMNFLPATLAEEGSAVHLPGGERLALKGQHGEEGRAVTLGVRPEHVRFDPDNGTLALTAGVVEELGADTLIHGTLSEGGPEITARVAGERAVRPGDRLLVAIAPDRLHLFDPESGKRL
ncbi:MAG: sn-glycerol-3-phosphate import ATP-binding protein UgpC [Pseudomonadota bacterium]